MRPTSELHDGSDARADAAAIERVLDGDTQAFAQLVERYQGPLYRHAVAMVLDHDTAADMVQDAFVRAYTHLESCRDRARFRSWLFRTLRNRCLDHLKEARRRTVPLEDAEPIPDGGPNPAAAIEHTLMGAAIAEALAQLPEGQREAFVMHYVEGLPYDTMAALTETSVSALKMRALRAREALCLHLVHRGVTEAPPARLSWERG